MDHRPDPYTTIHKALRKALFEAAIELGRLDPDNAEELNAATSRLHELISLLRSHAMHEETYFHPLIAHTGALDEVTHAHDDHEYELRRIEGLIAALQYAAGDDKREAAAALYQEWNLFVAKQIAHLHYEEHVVLHAMRKAVPDEHILQAHGRLVGSLQPSESLQSLTMICEAESAPVVSDLLTGLEDKLPADAFAGLMQAVFQRSARARCIAHKAGIADAATAQSEPIAY